MSEKSSALRSLVTATSDLQEQLQNVVRCLEQEGTPEGTQGSSWSQPPRSQPQGSSSVTPSRVGNRVNSNVGTLQNAQSQGGLITSLFNWNPSSSVGKKRKSTTKSRAIKKMKLPTWTHTYVALASVNQETVPDSQERAELLIAGLGEKRITISADAEVQEIYSELSVHFPKLLDSGGFELLRVPEGGKQLDVIACPESGYTVSYLRAVVHYAKIYIRPMQKELSLDPIKDENFIEPPREQCYTCGNLVSITALKEHITSCKKALYSEDKVNKQLNVAASYELPDFSSLLHDEKAENKEETVLGVGETREDAIKLDERISDDSVSTEVDDPVLEVALHLSKAVEQPQPSDKPESAADVVSSLRKDINMLNSKFEMVVRRGSVLSDALRRMDKISFDLHKPLKVVFVGEQGSDTGGLTREFFRLLQYSVSSKYLDKTGCFKHNAVAYQECIYLKLGNLAAMSLVYGGASFNIFSPCVYNFLCQMDAANLIADIDEVPNLDVRETLKKIEKCENIEVLRDILVENVDLLMECGFVQPLSKVELTDKPNIVQTITLHKVVLVSLAELSQFREGLSILGIGNALSQHPWLLRSFFCLRQPQDKLTSDFVRNLFTEVCYSESGSNTRRREETAFMFFVDYLDDCERVETGAQDNENAISLKTVLVFFTGADCLPPSGYESAILTFNPTNPYPTASTCALQLTLPTKYEDYYEFKKSMDVALTMHGGFGLI